MISASRTERELIERAIAEYANPRPRQFPRHWAYIRRLLGNPPVSLVRNYIPSTRLACGCTPEHWEPTGKPIYHSPQAHADQAKYEARWVESLDEAWDWAGSLGGGR